MWHTSRVLSESSAAGDVLHSFFGYSDAPTPLQLVVYATYLAVVIVAYLGLRARMMALARHGPGAHGPQAPAAGDAGPVTARSSSAGPGN
jgi:hypothetical protein